MTGTRPPHVGHVRAFDGAFLLGDSMNQEYYRDPTAELAVERVERERQYIGRLRRLMREICALSGYKIVGEIKLERRR